MAKKKKDKGLMGDALLLGKTSIGLGVISSVAEKAGGNAGALTTVGSFLPSVGSLIGGKAVIKQLKKIKR